MDKKKILVWETLATVSGGQKMTLTILDLMKDQCEFLCLIPGEGLLSAELNRRGIPYVLMGDQTLPTGVKGKKVVARYGWMSVCNILKSLIQIKKFDPDILYAPGPAALPWSAVCGLLTQKPVVWHLHHVFLDGATKKLLNICGRWKSVKSIVAVSHCVGEQIQNEKAAEKVEVLYNPVDVDKYANGDAEPILKELRETMGIDVSDRLMIGHVALIQRSKRQDFVLEVLAKLKESGQSVLGLFAGECREPEYGDELQKKLIELGLEKDVLFLGRRADIPNLLKATDVLMIPSAFEGVPLAGLEAAAAGVPVAACDVAGAKEFAEVSGGVVFAEQNVESAACAVLSSYERVEELREQGLRFAHSASLQLYGERVAQVFDGVIKF